jgi:DivIVA domain-containing protein
MEMNPQRVRSAEFKTVRKGVDPDEVRVFLGDVADELERAQNQSTAMEARARAAVARLQEISERGEAPAPVTVDASVDEAETISRTLLLAQRTADTTVAEARAEAARLLAEAGEQAARTLDSTREMAAQLLAEAREEAREVGEAERVAIAGEVDSLKARRDFLESDVDHLEAFLVDQRARIREAATTLLDVAERVPGGLGETRRPLLSASDDDTSDEITDDVALDAPGDLVGDDVAESDLSELIILTAEDPGTGDSDVDASGGDDTQAMPAVIRDDGDGGENGAEDGVENRAENGAEDDDFRFSFDDDRS